MVAIKAHEAERRAGAAGPGLAPRPDLRPRCRPRLRARRALARASVDDPDDAFQLIRMDGDDIAADPAEAGRRGQHHRPVRRQARHPRLADIASRCSPPSSRCWRRRRRTRSSSSRPAISSARNPLRTACEKARTALAVPCYGDAARDLGRIIDEMVRAAGKIDRPRRPATMLAGLLGGDRQTSRREIEKLLLYVGAEPAVTSRPCRRGRRRHRPARAGRCSSMRSSPASCPCSIWPRPSSAARGSTPA